MTAPTHDACAIFRAALAAALRGSSRPDSLSGPQGLEFAWHGHLIGCADCRALLEREEALEALLASLPAPELPPALAARVLTALRSETGSDRLEALLDLDHPSIPSGLADRVLHGMQAARQDMQLDALLDRAGTVDVPNDLAQRVLAGARTEARLDALLDESDAVRVPAGLAARVLEGLQPERVAVSKRGGFRLLPGLTTPAVRRFAGAAALVLGAAGLWRLSGPGAAPQLDVPEALLADLDMLEAMSFDYIVIDTINNVDPSVEILFED